MKKTLLALSLFLSIQVTKAQNGLENVIVEKYYISNAADSIGSVANGGGALPVGSVTYRLYADMLPGYKFQAVYGVNTIGFPHECKIQTSTLFFNNEYIGSTSPAFSKTQAKNNSVMLDSWLSVGAACNANFGILKSLDNGINTNTNNNAILQNNNPNAGIPLTIEDGLIAIAGRSPEPVQIVGINTTVINVFNDQNDGTNGPLFSTWNGSWAALNGAVGPDSSDNKVLIGQFTTDGTFSFELNIQIGTPTGGVERYVAQNPNAANFEYQMASLTYSSSTSNIGSTASANSSFIVYPNPSNNVVNLVITSTVNSTNNSFTIYNLEGQSIMHKEIGRLADTYNDLVDISGFSNGFYLLEFNSDGAKTTKKFIKN